MADRKNIKQARILAILVNSVTTDHISPAGNIKPDSLAGPLFARTGCRN